MIDFLKSLFGLSIPSTEKYESRQQVVEDAYRKFQQIDSSYVYKKFLQVSTDPSPRARKRFKVLKRNESVKLYGKLQRKYAKQFSELHRWESTFEEQFTSRQLELWSTKPFWSEVFINQPYAQATDLHLPTDGKNLEHIGSELAIVTRKEGASGLAWDSKLGFVSKIFSYTSGMVTTSTTFRQQYGKFSAKVKMSKEKGLYHTFWLGADKMLPHINVFTVAGGRVALGAYLNGKEATKRIGSRLTGDFYVFTLIWDPSGVTWEINGKKIFETRIGINTPLYVGFASGVRNEVAENHLPQTMNIEWVKCFQRR